MNTDKFWDESKDPYAKIKELDEDPKRSDAEPTESKFFETCVRHSNHAETSPKSTVSDLETVARGHCQDFTLFRAMGRQFLACV